MTSMSPLTPGRVPARSSVSVRYEVPHVRPDWTLAEASVPESKPHDLTIELLRALLTAWIARTGRDAEVARNLAVRWEETAPQIGIDPDLCVIAPATPEGDELESLCTWRPGHMAPVLAIEVVSSRGAKDYDATPERCAAAGIGELWVFDARLSGPRRGGGPHRLQVWRRAGDDFVRVYAGEGPARSEALDAWVFAVDEGRRLRIAEDREGTRWWRTREEEAREGREAERVAKEAERVAREAERIAKEAERAAKEAALARLAELEARLSSG